jgi:hypothetical protein
VYGDIDNSIGVAGYSYNSCGVHAFSGTGYGLYASSDMTFDTQGSVTGGKVSILRPDGTTLASTSISTGGSDIDTVSA